MQIVSTVIYTSEKLCSLFKSTSPPQHGVHHQTTAGGSGATTARSISTPHELHQVVYTEWYTCGNHPKGLDVVTDQKYTLLVNMLQ